MGAGPGPIEPEGIFDDIRWRSVLWGVFIDILLTAILSLPLLLAFAGPEYFSESEATSRAAEARAYESDLFNLISLAAGMLCTLAGAFFGARRAGQAFVRHGGWVGASSLVLGIVMLASLPAEPSAPMWVDLVSAVLIVPAGIVGGALAAALGRRVA